MHWACLKIRNSIWINLTWANNFSHKKSYKGICEADTWGQSHLCHPPPPPVQGQGICSDIWWKKPLQMAKALCISIWILCNIVWIEEKRAKEEPSDWFLGLLLSQHFHLNIYLKITRINPESWFWQMTDRTYRQRLNRLFRSTCKWTESWLDVSHYGSIRKGDGRN